MMADTAVTVGASRAGTHVRLMTLGRVYAPALKGDYVGKWKLLARPDWSASVSVCVCGGGWVCVMYIVIRKSCAIMGYTINTRACAITTTQTRRH